MTAWSGEESGRDCAERSELRRDLIMKGNLRAFTVVALAVLPTENARFEKIAEDLAV